MKAGTTVKFTRRNGQKAVGRVVSKAKAANGLWVAVNTAELRQPAKITYVRPSMLSLA